MNNKESILYKIVGVVVVCCATIIDGKQNITTEQVLSRCRTENVVMTRQIVAIQIKQYGYTTTTIAQLLGCSPANARKLLADGYDNIKQSRAFHLAYAEATIKCRDLV